MPLPSHVWQRMSACMIAVPDPSQAGHLPFRIWPNPSHAGHLVAALPTTTPAPPHFSQVVNTAACPSKKTEKLPRATARIIQSPPGCLPRRDYRGHKRGFNPDRWSRNTTKTSEQRWSAGSGLHDAQSASKHCRAERTTACDRGIRHLGHPSPQIDFRQLRLTNRDGLIRLSDTFGSAVND
jgi:hypothetical protein